MYMGLYLCMYKTVFFLAKNTRAVCKTAVLPAGFSSLLWNMVTDGRGQLVDFSWAISASMGSDVDGTPAHSLISKRKFRLPELYAVLSY